MWTWSADQGYEAGAMRAAYSPRLGRWAWLALWTTAATVLLTDVNRFLPPSGEKYVDYFPIEHTRVVGGVDLLPTFVAAHAWRAGQNPYHFKSKKLRLPNPWSSGERFTFVYPPTQFFVYVPLATYVKRNFEKMAKIQFYISIAATILIALAMLELIQKAFPLTGDQRAVLLPLLVFLLACNPGGQLGFERGQTDTTSSALCWWGAVLFGRRKFGWAMFLATAGALFKGYGLPFAAGLALLGLRRNAWRGTLLGSGLAVLILLAPVAKWLPFAWGSFQERSLLFWSSWNNQSVYNMFHVIDPHMAPAGYAIVVSFAGAVMALSWWRTRKSLLHGGPGEQAIALVLYTTSSLLFILACSKNSIAYDGLLILPGALCLAILQARLLYKPSKLEAAALGLCLSGTLFALCAMSIPRVFGREVPLDFPSHAVGQIILMVTIAVLCVRAPFGFKWGSAALHADDAPAAALARA